MSEHETQSQDPESELERIRVEKMKKMVDRARKASLRLGIDYPKTPITVTDENFEQLVQRYPLFIVDCWAAWCYPCRIIAPIVDELARDYAGRIVFGKLNVDENPRTAERFGITGIPTLLILRSGGEVDRIVGAAPRTSIESTLQRWM